MPKIPTAEEILDDPAASTWLRMALTMALRQDCVDAANDAATLAAVLQARADKVLQSMQMLTEGEDGISTPGKTD
jgi:hypothetical protein